MDDIKAFFLFGLLLLYRIHFMIYTEYSEEGWIIGSRSHYTLVSDPRQKCEAMPLYGRSARKDRHNSLVYPTLIGHVIYSMVAAVFSLDLWQYRTWPRVQISASEKRCNTNN